MSKSDLANSSTKLPNRLLGFLLGSAVLVGAVFYFDLDFRSVVYFYFTEILIVWIFLELIIIYHSYSHPESVQQPWSASVLGMIAFSILVSAVGVMVFDTLGSTSSIITPLTIAALSAILAISIKSLVVANFFTLWEEKKHVVVRLGFLFLLALFLPDLISDEHGLSEFSAVLVFVVLRILLELCLVIAPKIIPGRS